MQQHIFKSLLKTSFHSMCFINTFILMATMISFVFPKNTALVKAAEIFLFLNFTALLILTIV